MYNLFSTRLYILSVQDYIFFLYIMYISKCMTVDHRINQAQVVQN